jgi:hypothetical protein
MGESNIDEWAAINHDDDRTCLDVVADCIPNLLMKDQVMVRKNWYQTEKTIFLTCKRWVISLRRMVSPPMQLMAIAAAHSGV